MSDHSQLKQLAEASIQAWDQHSKADSHEFHDAWCKADAEFSAAAREEVVLALIADLERHQRMLLAACMGMGAIGEVLGADMDSDGEELLSMVVDMKAALEKEKALSKGWYENWKGTIVERDQLKAERDNLREDRDGLLEAGAHLL